MKKLLSGVLATIMLLTMAACTQEALNPPSTEPSKPAKQDVTITYMASNEWVQDAEVDGIGPKFTEETGIKVDYQIVPSDQYTNLLLTKLNSGECTDIFGNQGGKFDIVTYINVEKNAVDLSAEAWVSRLDPLAAVEVSVDGKVYGQPIQDISSVWAIAYNKKIFANLNLNVPTTFAEFEAVCEAIKNSGVTPIYECVSDGWHHVLWFLETSPAIEKNEPGTEAKLNSNQTTFAKSATSKLILEQIKGMVDKGYWGTNYMDNEYANAAKNFAEGKYAMVVENQGFPALVNAFDPNFSADDVGFFVLPLADNQILNVNPVCPTRFVYSGSKNVDAAKQYLEFIARPESLQYLIDNVPKFNTLPISGANDKYTESLKAFYNAYPEHGTVYQTSVKYVNPQWMEIGKDLTSFILGQIDSAKVLENMDKSRDSQAATAKDPAW